MHLQSTMAGESCPCFIRNSKEAWVTSTTHGRLSLVAWPYAFSSFDTRWHLKSILYVVWDLCLEMAAEVDASACQVWFCHRASPAGVFWIQTSLSQLSSHMLASNCQLPKSNFADHFTPRSSLPWVLLRSGQNELPGNVATGGFP